MKLRNKKTGEIGELAQIRQYWREEKDGGMGYLLQLHDAGGDGFIYNSLAELNAEWEDYKPKEPLIKDKKIRKAVRAWANCVNGSVVCFYEDTGYEGVGRLKIYKDGYPAVFDLGHQFYDLELDTQYTIEELCGEEE